MADNLPPPPAGYTLTSALPPPPAGYVVNESPEIRGDTPVYSATTTAKQSPWDRAVEAFGEFMSPLQPEPGQPFEEKAGQILQGLADIPRRSGQALHDFNNSLMKGDVPGAAYHLAGVVPILGPMSQTVTDDIEKGDYAGAVGHAGAILATAGLAHPQ